jgi:hypothetical protein
MAWGFYMLYDLANAFLCWREEESPVDRLINILIYLQENWIVEGMSCILGYILQSAVQFGLQLMNKSGMVFLLFFGSAVA